MTYHRIFNKSNTTDVTNGAGTDIIPVYMHSSPVASEVCVAQSLVVLCTVLFLFVRFPLTIVLSIRLQKSNTV